MKAIRNISQLARKITHAALPSCRVFLGVKHEIFNLFPIRLAPLGQSGSAGSKCLPEVLLGAELSGLAVLNSLLDGEHDGGVLVLEVHAEKERFVTRKFNN